ncbi:MAG: hypothetical protein NZ551_02655 [Microscillaceae bacterium]|nr:hypothetical protein [Microscillaceae bacterium]MDW8460087.1 hypothetical protein [Cytophagales bacterium]
MSRLFFPFDIHLTFLLLCFAYLPGFAQENIEDKDKALPQTLKLGVLIQPQAVFTQERTAPGFDNNRKWATQMQLWRANLLLTGNVSSRTSFFMQSTILEPIGLVSSNGSKNIQSPTFIILDAQIEHQVALNLWTCIGMQLVNINRQGLQTISSLLGLEFGWYQYPHLFSFQPLRNNFSRDIGISLRGYTASDRLEYRLGIYRGGAANPFSNVRAVARLNYNFWDIEEKSHYYTGQTLGKQKILAWGAGVDWQGTYTNYGTDIFLDLPIGNNGAFTWSNNVMFMSGGNSTNPNTFTPLIPNQTIFFTEAGYLFKKAKLQPYVKYEGQIFRITQTQYNLNQEIQNNPALLVGIDNFSRLKSESRWGIGLNYYIKDFNFNVKLQYENITYERMNGSIAERQQAGEVKLQFNYFIF